MVAIKDVIDARRLMIFYHVAQTGSLSKAEAKLFIAQPAISRHISNLEEELGVKLLDRHGRGVTLTQYGEILYRQAEVILQDMANTLEQIDLAKRQPVGRVSVSASAIVMSLFMPEIINRLIMRHPEVAIVAIQAPSSEVYNSLVLGKVDVAIVMQVPNKHKYALEKLCDEPMVLIASKDHAVAAERVIKRSALTALDLILPASPNGMRGIIENYARAADIELIPHLEIDSVPLIMHTVARGRFCAIMPQLTFEQEFGEEQFVGLPLQPALSRSLYAATHRERPPSPYIDSLLEITAAVFKEKTDGTIRSKSKSNVAIEHQPGQVSL